MTFDLRGVRVTVTFGFCAVLALLLSLEQGVHLLPALLACGVHESGHILAAYACGMKLEAICFSALGIRMEGNTAGISHWRRAVISLAGPFMNFSFFLPLYVLDPRASAMQLLLFLFHILPAVPLDGGAALYSMLCARWPEERAAKVITAVSAVFALLLGTFGFYVLLRSRYNFTLLFLAVYILFYLVFKHREGFS